MASKQNQLYDIDNKIINFLSMIESKGLFTVHDNCSEIYK